MASICNVSLKNIKEFKGHEGEPCFQANIYLNNKKIGWYSDDSWGAVCLDLHLDSKEYRKEIEEIAKEYGKRQNRLDITFSKEYNLEYTLDSFIEDLLYLSLHEKDFKKYSKKYSDFVGFVVDKEFDIHLLSSNENYKEKAKKIKGIPFFSLDDFKIN